MSRYYRLLLDDNSAASFTSFDKDYFGTLEQIDGFFQAIKADEDMAKRQENILSVYDQFLAGKKSISHSVAHREVPFLVPAKILGEEKTVLTNHAWEHLNTWQCPYQMRCDKAESTHLWVSCYGKYSRVIQTKFTNLYYYRVMPVPKTVKGIRKIPMFKEVREALLAEQKHQEEVGTANTIIDGVGNWVFTNRYGTVLSPKSVNNAIERIIRDYNRMEEVLAKEQGRVPQLLPHITNHQLRHSFCTRLMEESCKPGSNIPLKLIQDIMGHADYSTTMDI